MALLKNKNNQLRNSLQFKTISISNFVLVDLCYDPINSTLIISNDTALDSKTCVCDIEDGSECIRVQSGVNFTILNSEITATDEHIGRGIELEKNSTLHVTNVRINKFKSSVIYARNVGVSNVTIEGCDISDNINTTDSVISITRSLGYLKITNSLFDNNSGLLNGGAVSFNYSREMNITNTNFTNNKAAGVSGSGGAVSVAFSNVLTIDKCQFESNEAIYRGGGLWVGNVTRGVIKSSQFLNNTAVYGGGIFYYNGSLTVSNDVVIKGNVATGSRGNGVYCFSLIGITLPEPPIDDDTNCFPI